MIDASTWHIVGYMFVVLGTVDLLKDKLFINILCNNKFELSMIITGVVIMYLTK